MSARQKSPATARNREPILTVLQRVLPSDARVLELASGAGEHAVFFAAAMPGVIWQPSDPSAEARESIAAWIEAERLKNVLTPIGIDVCEAVWGVENRAPFDALVAINMIHISPWEATIGLMRGARRLLRDGGILYTYGPYTRDGQHTAPSNEAFDASLKARDSRWGVRDVADVEKAARENALQLRESVEMPANNLSLVFVKWRLVEFVRVSPRFNARAIFVLRCTPTSRVRTQLRSRHVRMRNAHDNSVSRDGDWRFVAARLGRVHRPRHGNDGRRDLVG